MTCNQIHFLHWSEKLELNIFDIKYLIYIMIKISAKQFLTVSISNLLFNFLFDEDFAC